MKRNLYSFHFLAFNSSVLNVIPYNKFPSLFNHHNQYNSDSDGSSYNGDGDGDSDNGSDGDSDCNSYNGHG